MTETVLTKSGDKFLINGKLVYSEINGSSSDAHGLLMNARLIQGIFDDANGRERYARFGFECFDPDKNTDDLIAALPEWYKYGLRAFTVGFQGGGPCFTVNNSEINNNPFGTDGTTIDPAYLARMDKLIQGADKAGMAVIVSYFYGAQAERISDDLSIMRTVKTASNWLRDKGYKNVIIEIANEHTVPPFLKHPILYTPDGVVTLMDIARRESGGMMVGCSDVGGGLSEAIAKNSDIVLIHGNGQSRQQFYKLICDARKFNPTAPIVCNEDSQAITNMAVSYKTGTSWGYYNNLTKQEPPARWGVLEGEDKFFAYRMAMGIGIKVPELPESEQFYLAGLEEYMTTGGKRWIRLASLYPEKIDHVDFFRNGEYIYTGYCDPFTINYRSNWLQGGTDNLPGECTWEAKVLLTDGRKLELKKTVSDKK